MNILLLHGLAGSGAYFQSFTGQLRSHPRTKPYAPDLLGFGKNSDHTGPFDMQSHLNYLDAEVSRVFGDEPMVIMGHSMGGVLALHWAAHHISRIQKIVLLNTPLGQTQAEIKQAITEEKSSSLDWGKMILNYPTLSHVACIVLCKHHGMNLFKVFKPKVIPNQVFKDYTKHSWKSVSLSFKSIILKSPALPLLEKLGTIPILNVIGSNDSPLMQKQPKFYNIQNLKIAGGHHVLFDDPKIVISAIESFTYN